MQYEFCKKSSRLFCSLRISQRHDGGCPNHRNRSFRTVENQESVSAYEPSGYEEPEDEDEDFEEYEDLWNAYRARRLDLLPAIKYHMFWDDEAFEFEGPIYLDRWRDVINRIGHGCLEVEFKKKPFQEKFFELMKCITQYLREKAFEVRKTSKENQEKVSIRFVYTLRKRYRGRTFYQYDFENGTQVSYPSFSGDDVWTIISRNAGPYTYDPQYKIQREGLVRVVLQKALIHLKKEADGED